MKIRLSDIGPAGLEIHDSIPLQSLNDRMQEGRNSDIVFVQAPQINLQVRRTSSGAEICGKVSSRYKQPCSICLKEIEQEISSNIKLNVLHETSEMKAARENGQDDFDDVGIIFFSGEQLELEDTLQESLILKLSQFWHPEPNAKGDCSSCGQKISKINTKQEEKQSLAQLLKKAGVS